MSWILAFAGFAALIILHELGHFMAAKAVGMRVERFALFFPPLLFKVRRGETEYGIGAVPLGGYVRITGMNPAEEIPPEVAHRAYFRQPVWKRIVVIVAGPAMNVLIAFAILWALFVANGTLERTLRVDGLVPGQPAAAVLRPGDRIVSVDGRPGYAPGLSQEQIRDRQRAISLQIASHRCAGRPVDGCRATTAARIVVDRGGRRLAFTLRPQYDAAEGLRRTRLGFAFAPLERPAGPLRAATLSGEAMWRVTRATLELPARLLDPQQRKDISGVVGSYEVTRRSIEFDTTQALNVLAIISLSLAIINLFPFLPLDGGHIFWALAEKLRGRAIPFSVMERAGVVGFMIVIFLFVIGLTNDIDRLRGEGFGVR